MDGCISFKLSHKFDNTVRYVREQDFVLIVDIPDDSDSFKHNASFRMRESFLADQLDDEQNL